MRCFFLMILIFCTDLRAGEVCKRANECCNPDYNNCGYLSSCTSAGQECVLPGTNYDCTDLISPKALTTTTYHLGQGQGTVNMGVGGTGADVNYLTFYDNPNDPSCSPYDCVILLATSLGGACNGSPISVSYTFDYAGSGELTVGTTATFDNHVCIRCQTMKTDTEFQLKTNNFKLTIDASGQTAGGSCTGSSTIQLGPALTSVSHSFSISQDTQPEISFSTAFEDEGADSCTVSSVAVVKSNTDTAAHDYLEWSANKVVMKLSSRYHIQQTYNFALMVTFENGATHFAAKANGDTNHDFAVECGSSSTTVSFGSFPTVGGSAVSAEQYYATVSNSKFYLPIAISSLETHDSGTSCSISTRTVGGTTELGSVQSDSDGYYVQPVTHSVAKHFTFTFTATAVGGATATYSAHTLTFHLGCHSGSSFTNPNAAATLTKTVGVVAAGGGASTLNAFNYITSSNPNCLTVSTPSLVDHYDSLSEESTVASLSCSGTICGVATSVNQKPRIIKFKIQQTFSDSATQTSPEYTVTFTCSAAQQAIQLDYATGITRSVAQNSADNKIIFGPYECQNPNCCGTMNYAVMIGDQSTPHTFVQETNGSYSFTFDTATPGSTSYFVKVDSGDGNNLVWQADITTTPVCDSSSEVVLSPASVASPFTVDIASGVQPKTSALTAFADSGISNCAITTAEVVVSESDHTLNANVELSASNEIQVKDLTRKHVADVYIFAIKITFENGEFALAKDASNDGALSLTVQCTSSSTTVSFGSYPTVNSVALATEQYVTTSSTLKYYLPEIVSSLASIDATASCSVSTRTTTLGAVQQDANGYYVEAASAASQVHTFTYTATAIGGATATSSSLKLHVGCYSPPGLVDPNSNTVQNYDVAVGSPQALTSYSFWTSSNPNCVGVSGSILYQTDSASGSTVGLVTADCSSGTACSVSTTLNYAPRTLQYVLMLTYADGHTQQSTVQSATFTCTAAQEQLSLDTTTVHLTLDQHDTTGNTITAYSTTCIVSQCCPSITYDVTIGDLSTPYSFDDNRASKTFQVDTSATGVTSYFFIADNNLGQTASREYRVTISSECSQATSIKISTALPYGSELDKINEANGTAYRQTPSQEAVLKFKYDVSVSQTFEVELGQRFTSLKPSQCPIQNCKITSISQLRNDQPLSPSQAASTFTLSSQSLLSVKYEVSMPVNETYYLKIDAYNGQVWSSFTTALVEIELCEYCSGTSPVPAVAPYFLEPIAEVVQVNSTQETTTMELPLPEIFDPNLEKWAIRVEGSPFVKLSSNMKSLEVDLASVKQSTNITFEIIITDTSSRSSSYLRTIEVKVEPKESSSSSQALPSGDPTESAAENPEEGKEPELSLPSAEEGITLVQAKISGVSALGELQIKFSELPLFVHTQTLKTSDLDIYVRPAAKRWEDESFEVSRVNLTWSVTGFDQDTETLLVQLKFKEPLQISTLETQDEVVFHFKEASRPFGTSIGTRAPLSPSSWTLTSRVTRQMPVTKFTKNFEQGAASATVSLEYLLIASIALNILSQGGMIYMLQMIRSLQIVLHFPLLRIVVPANVNMFFSYMIPIVMFDVLDPEWTTELVLDFDEEGQEEISGDIQDQMKDLGYETHNAVLNLGSLSIFLVAYFVKLGLFVLAVGIVKLTQRGTVIASFLKNGLFYGDIIAIVLDAYFEFIISGYLQATKPLWTASGERVANYVGWASFVLAFVWFPLVQLWQISKTKEGCQSEAFSESWGNLLDGVSTETRWKRAYFLVFILRRLIFFLIAIRARDYIQFQIMGMLALNVAYFLYLGLVKPHDSREIYRIEMVNEFLIHLGTIALLLFTDWVGDGEMQYNAGGYGQIVTIILLLFGDLYFVFKSMSRRISLNFKRYKRRLLSKFSQPDLELEFQKAKSSANSSQDSESPRERRMNTEDKFISTAPPSPVVDERMENITLEDIPPPPPKIKINPRDLLKRSGNSQLGSLVQARLKHSLKVSGQLKPEETGKS